MLLDGLLADAELFRDLLVLASTDDAVEDLRLPRCQARLLNGWGPPRSLAHTLIQGNFSNAAAERAGTTYT